MTKDFENMLYLLCSGIRGIHADALEMDMEKIRACAISQGVWPIVYKAAEKTSDLTKWRNEFIFTMAKSITRRDFTLNTIRKLHESGIQYCLLKGPVIAQLYAYPDCRLSGDIDILIRSGDAWRVKAFLEGLGYNVENPTKNDHHFKAVHPVGGLLEVHVSLHSKTTEKIVFNGHLEYSYQYVKTTIDGNEYYVMNPDDEIVYLTAHYIKHLVSGGCGIRQITDLLLYMERNWDTIDYEKYNRLMENLRYNKLIDVIKTIGTMYFKCDYPKQYEEMAEKLLTDTEKGGTFGFLADDRLNFHNLYCAHRTNKSKLAHKVFMNLNSERTLFNRLFPSKDFLLEHGYGYAKNSFLVPAAWVHKLFDTVVRRKKQSQQNQAAHQRSLSRLEMMKELDMID